MKNEDKQNEHEERKKISEWDNQRTDRWTTKSCKKRMHKSQCSKKDKEKLNWIQEKALTLSGNI